MHLKPKQSRECTVKRTSAVVLMLRRFGLLTGSIQIETTNQPQALSRFFRRLTFHQTAARAAQFIEPTSGSASEPRRKRRASFLDILHSHPFASRRNQQDKLFLIFCSGKLAEFAVFETADYRRDPTSPWPSITRSQVNCKIEFTPKHTVCRLRPASLQQSGPC